MPTQIDETRGNYKPETDTKESDPGCSASKTYDENDAAREAENTYNNDHTVTMSLAGSISLGTIDTLKLRGEGRRYYFSLKIPQTI